MVASDDGSVAGGEGRLELHFQPQVDLCAHHVLGVEALVRWRHPDRGLLGPHVFLGSLDTAGHDRLARFVIREALGHARDWRERGIDVALSVNVEPVSLTAALPTLVAQALAASGTAPGRLKLEITEGSLAPADAVDECLAGLRALGVQLSLDDFGTGFSSLSRLHRVAVDELKVDRRFLVAACSDSRARTIAASVARLGRELGVRVVAEGIETAPKLDLVRELGFCTGQGYLFARPLPADDALAWIAARRAGARAATKRRAAATRRPVATTG